jgi:hypothetical protein
MENIELSNRLLELELRQVVIIRSLQEISKISTNFEWKIIQ